LDYGEAYLEVYLQVGLCIYQQYSQWSINPTKRVFSVFVKTPAPSFCQVMPLSGKNIKNSLAYSVVFVFQALKKDGVFSF